MSPQLYRICNDLSYPTSYMQDRQCKLRLPGFAWENTVEFTRDPLHCKLILKHIKNDTFDCTGLHMIPSLRIDFDSYLYGKLLELLRVSSLDPKF